MADLRKVSKEDFFAVINPLNVHPRPQPDASYWELPNRKLIGKITPGYMCVGPKAYFLSSEG